MDKSNTPRLTQREANRKALDFAATYMETTDFISIFGDQYQDCDPDILDKAQKNAVRRIRGLIP